MTMIEDLPYRQVFFCSHSRLFVRTLAYDFA